MKELTIVGYNSDSPYLEAKESFRHQELMKSKEINNRKKQKRKLEENHRAKNPFNQECFVYLVRGEKVYYRIYRELDEFAGYGTVHFLGVAMEVGLGKSPKIKNIPTTIFKSQSRYIGYRCCYCEDVLTKDNATREHVIPKHKGGNIIKPCCRHCNSEKGGFMLHTYIDMLNLTLPEYENGTQEFKRLQLKIKNTNRIAKELSKI